MIRVVIADDQQLVRMGFRLLLDAAPDIDVVAEASNGVEAVAAARQHHPDVVLMDVRMPRTDGITATAAILRDLPDTRIIILTTFDLDEYAFAGLRTGASGFLLKDIAAEQLLAAVRAVAAGDAVISPRVTHRMLDLFGTQLPISPTAAEDPLAALTPRERDVLHAIARGLTNAEIAAELVTSESTIKTHIGRVLAKLELRDRVHAVIFAYEHGLTERAG